MSNSIRLLPEALANQIAAGEVIQRPASVVKELIENAVDAGANSIKLILKNSGKTLIQVIDDGLGMSQMDARMSFERHATSKISSTEELFKLTTKGFRGEALASIAAIAQVELKTASKNNELGTHIVIAGSKLVNSVACQAQQGSNFIVKNLFYNVPARRKFLKSDLVELRHALEEFVRIALAHPNIQFLCFHNDKQVYHLNQSNLRQRLVGIFGNSYNDRLIPLNEELQDFGLQGFIGKPQFAKKSRTQQYFFVNQRYIKSHYFNHAVKIAYEELIASDQFPFFTLFITINPSEVDINVHPTKQEVKFEDDRLIYNYIRTFVKRALGKHSILPKLDFQTDINNGFAYPKNNFSPQNTSKTFQRQSLPDKATKHEAKQWKQTYESLINKSPTTVVDTQAESIIFPSTINKSEEVELEQSSSIFQINQSMIVTTVKRGLMVINQQAAHERILYERYLKQLRGQSPTIQRELFPQMLELNPQHHAVFVEIRPQLLALGYLIEPFGGTNYVVQGVPAGQKTL